MYKQVSIVVAILISITIIASGVLLSQGKQIRTLFPSTETNKDVNNNGRSWIDFSSGLPVDTTFYFFFPNYNKGARYSGNGRFLCLVDTTSTVNDLDSLGLSVREMVYVPDGTLKSIGADSTLITARNYSWSIGHNESMTQIQVDTDYNLCNVIALDVRIGSGGECRIKPMQLIVSEN